MSYATQARPYAFAAYDLAAKNNRVDEWSLSLAALKEALSFDALRSHMKNPTITLDSKVDTLELICREWMSDDFKRFVRLLGENDRLLAIEDICAIFIERKEAATRQVPSTFTTAFELGDDQQKKLAESVAQKTGLNLVSTFVVDPEIIGGVIVRFNGNVIDISVRNQLAQLKHNLIR